MAKDKDQITDAYRAERKERLAKQAKQSGKKKASHEGGKQILGRVIAIALGAVVVGLALWGLLSHFGVPQRMTKAVYVDGKGYSQSELNFYYMAAYQAQINTASYYDQNYGEGSGSSLTGFDANVSPANQTTKDDDGNEISWADKLMNTAVDQLANVKRHVAAAEEAGITLDEDAEAEIQETLDTWKGYVEGKNYSLSTLLRSQYGSGVNVSMFTRILREQKLAEVFDEQKEKGFEEGVAEEEIVSIYEESVTDYDVVDLKLWQVSVETTAADEEAEDVPALEDVTGEALAETASEPALTEATSEADASKIDTIEKAQAEADAIVAEIKAVSNYNEDTFVEVVNKHVAAGDTTDYSDPARTSVEKVAMSTLTSNVSADAAKWAFENKGGAYTRQVGEISTFATTDGKSVYVVYVMKAPYQDNSLAASARHILIKFDAEAAEPASGEEVTDASGETVKTRAQAQAEAESILADYNNYVKDQNDGKADEDYFAELADKYSEDTGSVASQDGSANPNGSTGGLIADMVNNGSYVKNFEDWVFSEGDYAGQTRAEGDTAIIETEFGFHIMFYVGAHDEPTWKETIRENVASKAFEDWEKSFEDSFSDEDIVRKDRVVAKVQKNCLDDIEQRLTQS